MVVGEGLIGVDGCNGSFGVDDSLIGSINVDSDFNASFDVERGIIESPDMDNGFNPSIDDNFIASPTHFIASHGIDTEKGS